MNPLPFRRPTERRSRRPLLDREDREAVKMALLYVALFVVGLLAFLLCAAVGGVAVHIFEVLS